VFSLRTPLSCITGARHTLQHSRITGARNTLQLSGINGARITLHLSRNTGARNTLQLSRITGVRNSLLTNVQGGNASDMFLIFSILRLRLNILKVTALADFLNHLLLLLPFND
jgi:hypothetical protein